MQNPIQRSGCGRLLLAHAPSLAILAAVSLFIFSPLFPPSQWATHTHWGDALQHAYLVNWAHHVSWRAPWKYFDAPFFYPQKHATAFNNYSLLPAFLTSPLQVFGNPALSYNLTMLADVVLCAFSAYALLFWLTRHRRASVVAGLVFACNGDMAWHLAGHPGAVSPFFIPGMAGFYFAFRRGQRPWQAIACAGCALGQFLCSLSMGCVALVGLAVLWTADLAAGRWARMRRDWILALALLPALGAAYAASGPSRDVARRFGRIRELGESWRLAADPLEYFIPPRWEGRAQTVLGRWIGSKLNWPLRDENAQFFGYGPWLFAALALGGAAHRAFRRKTRDSDAVALALFFVGLVGFVLSLGPFLWLGAAATSLPLPFRTLYQFVPALRFMRSCARFAVLVGFFVAGASAIHLAQSRWFNARRAPLRMAVFLALLAALAFEFRPVSAPSLRWWPREPYEVLKRHGEFANVAAIPFDSPGFLIDSTARFPRSPSGYVGGLFNYRFETLKAIIDGFPNREALAMLAALDVEALAVYGKRESLLAADSPFLELVEGWTNGGLFRLRFADQAAIDSARRLLLDIPERPPLSQLDSFPPATQDAPALAPHTPAPHAVFQAYFPSSGLDLSQAGRVYASLSILDRGVDYAVSKLYWITAQDPQFDERKSAAAYFVPDGKTRVLQYNLSAAPAWKEGGRLKALRIQLIPLPCPGQAGRVEEIRIVP